MSKVYRTKLLIGEWDSLLRRYKRGGKLRKNQEKGLMNSVLNKYRDPTKEAKEGPKGFHGCSVRVLRFSSGNL